MKPASIPARNRFLRRLAFGRSPFFYFSVIGMIGSMRKAERRLKHQATPVRGTPQEEQTFSVDLR